MGWLAMILGLLGILFTLVPAPVAAGAEFNILHSNNITGHLFPCPT
jgi:hypothetical protein